MGNRLGSGFGIFKGGSGGGGGTVTSLTTTGTSGASTLIGGVLNIPIYGGGGGGIYGGSGSLTAATTITNAGFDLFIMGAGNLGLGTITPNEKLEVVGNAKVNGTFKTQSSSAVPVNLYKEGVGNNMIQLSMQNDAAAEYQFAQIGGSVIDDTTGSEEGAFLVQLSNNGSIDSSGVHKFLINGLHQFPESINGGIFRDANSGGFRWSLNLRNSANVIEPYAALATEVIDNTNGSEDGVLKFYARAGGVNFNSSNHQAILTGTGLGIGTATPTEKLEVVGNVKISGNVGVNVASPTKIMQLNSTNAADEISLMSSGTILSRLAYSTTFGGYIQLQNSTGVITEVLIGFGSVDYINTTSNFALGNGTASKKLEVHSALSSNSIDLIYNGYINARTGYNSTVGGYFQLKNNDATSTRLLIGFGSDDYINTGQNLGIGTTAPNVSALLDVSSTTKGFLPPVMTTTEMNAIGTPASGLMVFDRVTSQWMGYDGSNWVIIG